MLAWISYTLMVSALLGLAALLAERAARQRRTPTRWFWACAIVASLLLPTVISSVSVQLPPVFAPDDGSAPIALRDITTASLAPAQIAAQVLPEKAIALTGATVPDAQLKRAWLALSATMLLALAASALALGLRKRRWDERSIGGAQVFVAPDAGPAVVGLLRPRIVLPRWLAEAAPPQQALVIAHEQAHVDAGDPQLLTVALCLLVLMPWNLPLWWQLRRLRHAIEVDCDARVLHAGHDLQQYGEALIQVGQRQSGFFGAVAAMAGSRSLLERRIGLMVRKPARWSRTVTVLAGGLAVCVLAVAAQVAPPNAAGPFAAAAADPLNRQQVPVKASRLVHYVGAYQFDDLTLIEVTPDGRRLWMQMSRQQKLELYPEADDKFFSRDIDLQVSFKRDARGRVNAMVMRRLGVENAFPRLEPNAAAAADAKIASNAARTVARPGGAVLLKRNIDLAADGKVDMSIFTPALARQLAPVHERALNNVKQLGKVKAITFLGVGLGGHDMYRVQHEQGRRDWHLLLTDNGKVANVFVREVY